MQSALILPDRTVPEGALLVEDGRITAVGRAVDIPCPEGFARVEAGGGYVRPVRPAKSAGRLLDRENFFRC